MFLRSLQSSFYSNNAKNSLASRSPKTFSAVYPEKLKRDYALQSKYDLLQTCVQIQIRFYFCPIRLDMLALNCSIYCVGNVLSL